MADVDPTQPAAPADPPIADEQPQEAAPDAPTLEPDPAVVSDVSADTEPQSEPGPLVGDTPTTSPDAQVQAPGETPAVTVDQFTRRSDDDALEGSLVTVIDGEHAGQNAAFVSTVEHDETGYPRLILVRFQDATYDCEYAVVAYADVRPAAHPGHQ